MPLHGPCPASSGASQTCLGPTWSKTLVVSTCTPTAAAVARWPAPRPLFTPRASSHLHQHASHATSNCHRRQLCSFWHARMFHRKRCRAAGPNPAAAPRQWARAARGRRPAPTAAFGFGAAFRAPCPLASGRCQAICHPARPLPTHATSHAPPHPAMRAPGAPLLRREALRGAALASLHRRPTGGRPKRRAATTRAARRPPAASDHQRFIFPSRVPPFTGEQGVKRRTAGRAGAVSLPPLPPITAQQAGAHTGCLLCMRHPGLAVPVL
ncbi:MAG: hypothetical protein J3K34DRAFT_398178 [Monoraphidium minutum]|nr:MAG: hypothetical protein J3K34DRAFT_398178 [Monoraphidium minutum]